jgi:hypothetical protein
MYDYVVWLVSKQSVCEYSKEQCIYCLFNNGVSISDCIASSVGINDILERMWVEAVVAQFDIL